MTKRKDPQSATRSYAHVNRQLAKRYDEWMVAMHYATVTKILYRRIVRQFTDFLGDRSAATVNHDDILRFIARLSEDGATLGSVYRSLGVLRMFYDFLNLGGVVSYVAPRFVKLRRPWWNSLAPLSEPQVRRLIAATRTLRERALVEFFYGTGARLSEATHLKIEDLEWGAKMARVTGKLGKIRILLLTDGAVKALRAYIRERKSGFVFRQDYPVQKGVLTTRYGSWVSIWYEYGELEPMRRSKRLGRINSVPYETARKMHEELLAGHVLIRPDNHRPISKMAVQTLMRKIGQRAGLKKVTPHTLRRTFATHLYNHGASIEVVKALMGHVWMHTTMTYIRMSPDRLASAFNQCHPRGKLNA